MQVIYIVANKKTNYWVTPFWNSNNFLDSARLLSDGCLSAIIDAFMFCPIGLFDEVRGRTFQVN